MSIYIKGEINRVLGWFIQSIQNILPVAFTPVFYGRTRRNRFKLQEQQNPMINFDGLKLFPPWKSLCKIKNIVGSALVFSFAWVLFRRRKKGGRVERFNPIGLQKLFLSSFIKSNKKIFWGPAFLATILHPKHCQSGNSVCKIWLKFIHGSFSFHFLYVAGAGAGRRTQIMDVWIKFR